MIRRGFWLVAGAVLGVTGYRKASQLARAVPASRPARTGVLTLAPRPLRARRPLLSGRQVLRGAARAGRSAAQGAAFARDVRDGMAEYLDRHGPAAGRTLESQRGRQAPAGQRGRPAR
ncbi:MAG TPA: hypothetical protein VFV41_11280 [Streptosporangiaceae bacterium]|nr:hypothetical protein [Streptosporangiaceae bacterium]